MFTFTNVKTYAIFSSEYITNYRTNASILKESLAKNIKKIPQPCELNLSILVTAVDEGKLLEMSFTLTICSWSLNLLG